MTCNVDIEIFRTFKNFLIFLDGGGGRRVGVVIVVRLLSTDNDFSNNF